MSHWMMGQFEHCSIEHRSLSLLPTGWCVLNCLLRSFSVLLSRTYFRKLRYYFVSLSLQALGRYNCQSWWSTIIIAEGIRHHNGSCITMDHVSQWITHYRRSSITGGTLIKGVSLFTGGSPTQGIPHHKDHSSQGSFITGIIPHKGITHHKGSLITRGMLITRVSPFYIGNHHGRNNRHSGNTHHR